MELAFFGQSGNALTQGFDRDFHAVNAGIPHKRLFHLRLLLIKYCPTPLRVTTIIQNVVPSGNNSAGLVYRPLFHPEYGIIINRVGLNR